MGHLQISPAYRPSDRQHQQHAREHRPHHRNRVNRLSQFAHTPRSRSPRHIIPIPSPRGYDRCIAPVESRRRDIEDAHHTLLTGDSQHQQQQTMRNRAVERGAEGGLEVAVVQDEHGVGNGTRKPERAIAILMAREPYTPSSCVSSERLQKSVRSYRHTRETY